MRGKILALVLLLSGCAGGMLPGKIYSEQGRILDFEIEKAHRSGAVTAFDPIRGERFNGTYTGILPSAQVTSTGFTQSGYGTALGTRTASLQTNIANATAYLKGDKGSMLTCDITIEAGFSPHGVGTCSDQAGGHYRLQF